MFQGLSAAFRKAALASICVTLRVHTNQLAAPRSLGSVFINRIGNATPYSALLLLNHKNYYDHELTTILRPRMSTAAAI